MTNARRQIFAFSGILKSADDMLTNFDLTSHALSLAGKGRGQRVCYVPTAVGDSPISVEAKITEFATERPDVDFSVLTLFNQPSVPDIRKHLLSQDVILVEEGSVVNLVAGWFGLPALQQRGPRRLRRPAPQADLSRLDRRPETGGWLRQ